MEKLKDIKIKHNHTLTDILKVIIFGIVMLAPMFSILTRCLYVVCNKNAKDSYYGQTINEEVDYYYNGSQLKNNETYTLIYYQNNEMNFSGNDKYVYDVNYIETNLTLSQPIESYYMFRIVWANNAMANLYLFYGSNAYDNKTITAQNYLTFRYLGKHTASYYGDNSDISTTHNIFEQKTYNRNSYLDNVFEYSVEQLGNEQAFSWTKSTALYSSINLMTTQLGINNNNNTIAILLTYWFIVMLIYIVVDIIVVLITKMTHLN